MKLDQEDIDAIVKAVTKAIRLELGVCIIMGGLLILLIRWLG
jgi:hypothetical protein